MLKKIRVVLALLFWAGITLLLLDFTGGMHAYLGWMAKIQFLPAVLAVNAAVIIGLVLLTLVFGRIYCSVICPLGVFQDAVAHVRVASQKKNRKPYGYSKEMKWLRYGVWVLFIVAMVAGVQVLVALLAPYSAYGRMVQSLLQPVVLWGNNLLAGMAERAGSYAFYSREVWIRSLPTFIIAAVTLVVIVVLAWKGGRTWCNTVCPVGTTLSFLSRFAMFRPVIDTDKCKNCKACEHHCKASCINIAEHKIDYSRCVDCFNCIGTCKFDALHYKFAYGKDSSAAPQNDKTVPQNDKTVPQKDHTATENVAGRRAFLAATAVAVGTAALKAQGKKVDGGFAEVLPKKAPERETPLTPPGSKSVKDFYRHCTACQLCVAQCPNNVLRPSTDLKHLMQPEMSYEKGFCRPECTRCSELCPTGAIRKISREEKTEYHVGTARVDREACLSAQGESCGNCARKCPTGAIRMVEDPETGLSVPVVAEQICIGCGACEYLCPVRPVSAITVEGRFDHLETDSSLRSE